ncbi:Bacterial regulatory proteins, tetR family [bacterium YEK0313]|nr:Bacterial regulatory proteins, tetR family [bacterium YEK0313]
MDVKLPRPKTLPDSDVLEAALKLIHAGGPEALTFAALAKASGLSAATLVQRFGSKDELKRRALHAAWDHLDARTARLGATLPRSPEGAIAMLVALSADYGGIDAYAEGLLVLREDFRDPGLRARGAAWKAALAAALEARFACEASAPSGIGLMMASQWQGSLLWWAFEPDTDVTTAVEDGLRRFAAAFASPSPAAPADRLSGGGAPRPASRRRRA